MLILLYWISGLLICLALYLFIGLLIGATIYKKHGTSGWSWKYNIFYFIKNEGRNGILIYLTIWPIFIFFEIREARISRKLNL